MSPVQELQEAVAHLKPEEMAQFRQWFDEFDAVLWDKQFDADAQSGRLDKVAEAAKAEFKSGKFRRP